MKAELNQRLTEVGPGTPGGELLRRYWQPVALLDEFDPGLDPAEWAGLGSGEVKQPLAQKCAGGAGTPQGRSPMVQPFRATEVRIYR